MKLGMVQGGNKTRGVPGAFSAASPEIRERSDRIFRADSVFLSNLINYEPNFFEGESIMWKRRKFYSGAAIHTYQNTVDGAVIFYTLYDFLAYITRLRTNARKYGITVLGVCPMFDHTHLLTLQRTLEQLSRFIGRTTSEFVKEYNADCGRKGLLFNARFGSSAKRTDKAKRTCIAYLANNAPEKKLVARCEEYRWNLIAYAASDHPYSEKIVLRHASRKLRMDLKQVDACLERDEPLHYKHLRRLFRGLSRKEREQLTDYILSRYSPVDYDLLLSFYGSYRTMLEAINANNGNEYDIKEEYNVESHKAYREMLRKVAARGGEIKAVITLPFEQKLELTGILLCETSASPEQVRKFLHLKKASRS